MVEAPLSPEVLKQLTRLKGRVPDDFAPRELVVETPVGPYAVPPAVQALLAVEWPKGHVLLTKDEFEWEAEIPSPGEVERGLVREDRPWYAIGYHHGQWYIVVDLAEAAGSDDPYTYEVDHEGDQPVPSAETLSERLAGFKVKRPPAKKYAFARACAAGDPAAVREQLASGASLGPVNTTGLTPLHLAALSGQSAELVQSLVDAGADVNAAVRREIPSMHTFVDKGRLFGRYVHRGDTPLHAALSGLTHWAYRTAPVVEDLVRILLAAGADPNAANRYGRTPMAGMMYEHDPAALKTGLRGRSAAAIARELEHDGAAAVLAGSG